VKSIAIAVSNRVKVSTLTTRKIQNTF